MAFKAVQISKNVFWVGAIDWELADFHGYATNRGSTYNAYLILADKVTLIDTVKAPSYDEFMSRIEDVIEPEKIDYIVSNHAELDHTGALPKVIERVKPQIVFASAKGVETLQAYLNPDMKIEAVKDGETLDLGNRRLIFMDTKMVHWPDSMFSYLKDDIGVLFSNDAFGQHLASTERFVDEYDPWVVDYENARYFANILLPTSSMAAKVLKKVNAFDHPIDIIAPDHGLIWRKDIDKVLQDYDRWASGLKHKKAVIIYDTMWGSTSRMAAAIAEGISSKNIRVEVMPLNRVSRADVATSMLSASTLLVGSPNLNGTIFPSVADVLTYLKGLIPKNHTLYAGAFGSFGWSPAATKQIKAVFEEMKAEILGDPLQIKWKPDSDNLQACFDYGVEVAEKIG